MVELKEPEVWRRQAASDMEHARRSLDLGHHEWACYASQQAAEKYLKAVILASGQTFRFTHHLIVLVAQMEDAGLDIEDLPSRKRLVDLSDKHLLARYPLDGAMPPSETLTREHAQESIETAEKIAIYADRMLS